MTGLRLNKFAGLLDHMLPCSTNGRAFGFGRVAISNHGFYRHYDVAVDGQVSYLQNIKAKTGKGPEDFRRLAAEKGSTKYEPDVYLSLMRACLQRRDQRQTS